MSRSSSSAATPPERGSHLFVRVASIARPIVVPLTAPTAIGLIAEGGNRTTTDRESTGIEVAAATAATETPLPSPSVESLQERNSSATIAPLQRTSLRAFQEAFFAALASVELPSGQAGGAASLTAATAATHRVRFVFRGVELRSTDPSAPLAQLSPSLRVGDHLHAILTEGAAPLPPTNDTTGPSAALQGGAARFLRWMTNDERARPSQRRAGANETDNAAADDTARSSGAVPTRLIDPVQVGPAGVAASSLYRSEGRERVHSARVTVYVEPTTAANTAEPTMTTRGLLNPATMWLRTPQVLFPSSQQQQLQDGGGGFFALFQHFWLSVAIGGLIGFILGPLSILAVIEEVFAVGEKTGPMLFPQSSSSSSTLGTSSAFSSSSQNPQGNTEGCRNRILRGLRDHRLPVQCGIGIGCVCHLVLALCTPGQALSNF